MIKGRQEKWTCDGHGLSITNTIYQGGHEGSLYQTTLGQR